MYVDDSPTFSIAPYTTLELGMIVYVTDIPESWRNTNTNTVYTRDRIDHNFYDWITIEEDYDPYN